MEQAFNLLHCMCLHRGLNPSSQYRRPVALPTRLQIPQRILIPLLLCSPAEGPAVHVPPPAIVFAVLCFIASSAWNVSSFSPHLVCYRPSPCIADWNNLKRQPSQYGLTVLWRTLESHTRLALIHCARIRWCGWHASILFIRQLIIF